MGAAMNHRGGGECGRRAATVRRCFWRGRGEERWVARRRRIEGGGSEARRGPRSRRPIWTSDGESRGGGG
uniref:Uncharacterized protein n=1 Tax=Oryza rufipogon TaxID=4529 RepID=A0A0E0RG51_ORYRU